MINLNAQVWHVQNIEDGTWENCIRSPFIKLVNELSAKGYYKLWADGCDSHYIKIQYGEITLETYEG